MTLSWNCRLLAAASVVLGVMLAPACARTAELVGTGTAMGEVRLFLPEETAQGLLFLYSGSSGWSGELDRAAGRLARAGLAVAGIDLPTLLDGLDGPAAAPGDCLYLVSDIEALSKELQRQLGVKRYRAPILAGIGAGGTLAYGALAQAPAATVEGAVSLDAAATLATPGPLCPGAPSTPAGDGFALGRKDGLPGWWRNGTRGGGPGPLPWARSLAGAEQVALPVSEEPAEALFQLIAPMIARPASGTPTELADLPVEELPAEGAGPVLAIIFSGDGGWRDLDRQIGQWLAAHGVPVIGVDSLRYFWTARTPGQTAGDLARIARHYLAAWHRERLVLIGYSFGADVLPATVNRLPADLRRRIVQLSLLGLGREAAFEFHVAGWLGGEAADALPVAPAVALLEHGRIQCFHGVEEEDSLCPDAVLDGAERIRTAGGHHFDGDYAALAARILAGIERRGGFLP